MNDSSSIRRDYILATFPLQGILTNLWRTFLFRRQHFKTISFAKSITG